MSEDQLTTRVLFSSLLPAARMAAKTLVPLKEMKHLVELAYYRELRGQSLKMKEIRELMSVSMSKVGLLSQSLKAHFTGPELENELPRRILALLWAAPLSEKRIAQALSDVDPEEVGRAIRGLLEEKRIDVEKGPTVARYKLTSGRYRLVGQQWLARIDGLNNLLRSVSQVIERRFLNEDKRAFARTISFSAKAEDVPRLTEAYEQIFTLVCEVDERSQDDQSAETMVLSYFFTPEEE